VLHHPSYRLLGFALVLGVSLLRASSARADEARLRVVTEGSLAEADCLDTDRLALRVRALRSAGLTLGTGQGGASLTLDVSFTRQPDGTLRASLTAGAPIAGERVLFDKGAGCAALSEAVAVTVALLLDGAFFVASDATRRPVGTSDEAAEGVSARSASGQLLAAVGLTDGTVAELAPRFGLELVAHPTGRVNDRALELGFAFGYVVGGKSPLGLGSVRSAAAFGVARAGLRLGAGGRVFATGARAFGIVPSVTVAAGSVRAEGAGFDEDRATSRAFARVGIALPLSFEPGGPMVVRLTPSIDLATRRQSFVVSGLDDRVAIPRVSLTMLGSVGFVFF